MSDLDRFDLMLLRIGCPTSAPAPAVRAYVPEPTPREPRPVRRSPRGKPPPPAPPRQRTPRFVAYAPCPMCGFDRVGIEYHGTLLSGAQVNQLAAHAPGMGRGDHGKPRCLGAGMRMLLEGGVWKGAPA
jgi:hypothetical protein